MKSKLLLFGWTTALMASAAFVAQAAQLPNCANLAAQILANNKDISAATSAVQPATSTDKAYCLVNVTVSGLSGPQNGYLPGQKQMIQVATGLPLSSTDGGSGGVQGAWNGKIQDLGGGGYAGSIAPVTPMTDAGFAGSTTDTGHSAAVGGGFALNPDNSLNWGLIRDFAFNGIHAQATWSKKLVQMYYGTKQKYAYWTGCSTGGRQGHQQAQKYPNEYDGILAGDSAFNWDRFIPAELWAQVVMQNETGGVIAPAKLNAATQAAIKACDGLDGIVDGVIQEPRVCRYSAKALVCKGTTSDAATCLTAAEAKAIDKIWDGVVEGGIVRDWFGLERGTPLVAGAFGLGLAGATPFPIPPDHFRFWVEQNPSFDWHSFTEASFIQDMKKGEIKFHEVIGTDDPDLSDFRDSGGKMITYHGLADELIFPRGTYNYYNRVTERLGGLNKVQKFYRFFPYPGNGHCFGNSTQPNAPLMDTSFASGVQVNATLFKALMSWVEKGVGPDAVVAFNNLDPAQATVSRPICKYPDKLVFKGGNTNVASNFVCQHQEQDDFLLTDLVVPDIGAIIDRFSER
ncbi:MAG TPA: tannase/feruloyl esterase family alpha/beta hydrolase [Pseudolabrys sp.]|nr:tannase/feruloyl esterase family alpha/beta hydrolase [Pseudolabrys sp.]